MDKLMGINSQLKELYSGNWGELESEAKGISNITHPLLIKVDETIFCNSDIKVVIFGQETDGWQGKFPNEDSPLSVDGLMDEYQKYYYKSKNKNKRPFWNRSNFKYFEDEISKYFEPQGKKSAFIWNNISKIGKTTRASATGDIRKAELTHFKVVENELKILNPDIIIFTTGCSRDRYIKDAFGKENVEFEYPKLSFGSMSSSYETKSMVAKVNLANFPNICSVRVEHPNRRTLSNSVIFNVIKDYWETNSTSERI